MNPHSTVPSLHRPFRFGVLLHSWQSPADWRAKARHIAELGYATFLVADHLDQPFAAIPALAVAAEAAPTLRIGTFVLANDFYHPVGLAREIATLDQMSGGRVELGLGAGWRREDYAQTGLPYDSAGVRVRRLAESLAVIEGLFADAPMTFNGTFYTVANLSGSPKPAQRPHPPILLGGSGRQMLSLAAREADCISLIPRPNPAGSGQASAIWADASAAATERKLAWIREAAGARLAELELNVTVYAVSVGDERRRAARELGARFGLSEEDLLASPHFLAGTVEHMADDLRQRRERWGISYVVVPEFFYEAFAPLVARLSGA